MSKNRNQHYVPRCYLRPFCSAKNKQAIELYNVDNDKYVPNAPLKSQCSKSYFYGKDDDVEENIQHIEGTYSSILRRILADTYVLTESDKIFLVKFWLFQYHRTDAKARQSVALAADFAQATGFSEEENDFDKTQAISEGLKMFADNENIMVDLKVRLLKNKTKTAFITSDDPAILSNRWYELDARPNLYSFGGGMHSSGVVILLPLTPKIMLIGFDGDVYSIPHKNGWASVKNESDVAAFNQHQHLNYFENLYCVDEENYKITCSALSSATNVKKQYKYAREYMVEEAANPGARLVAVLDGEVRYVEATEEIAKQCGSAMIRNRRVRCKLDRWPLILKFRKKGTVYSSGTYSGYYRRHHAYLEMSRNPYKEFVVENSAIQTKSV